MTSGREIAVPELGKSSLPGIGMRYGFTTAHGGRLSIVDRDDGLCELYYFARAGDDELGS